MSDGMTGNFEVFKRELMLAPRQVRVRLLEKIEEFLAGLDAARSYPFDYIFHWITEHRPEDAGSQPVSGERVLVELARILDEVGRTVRVSAAFIDERVLTVEDLAGRWGVSSATVLRWREHGLAARFFTFGSARRKVGVRESLAVKFETARGQLIRRALYRRRVTAAEGRRMVEAALVGLARETPPVRLLADIARQFTLRQGKVQRIIAAAASDNEPLLALARARVSRREQKAIFREVSSGAPLEEVAERWGRPVESIRDVHLHGRARGILFRRLKVIHNDEFETARSRKVIMDAPELSLQREGKTASASDLPVYLKGIAGAPLLTREEEVAFFRKYNYLKFLAAHLGERLDPKNPSPALMDRIEKRLGEAHKVRERLVRSNLRLVVSIARRHHGRKTDFFSLVSDGNMALLDAIEAFDYARGNRFSTYAGWAIIRRFARTVPENNYRITSVEEEILQNTAQVEVDFTALKPAVLENGIATALSGLPERERMIIERRFALDGRDKPSTLQELGSVFGLTKERIRQIEAQALKRLRGIIQTSVPELVG